MAVHQVYAVFRNTFLETVRQPVYGLVLVLSCLLIAVTPAMAAHIYTFGAGSGLEKPAERMIADLGLATMLMSGLILAVVATSSVISREIENKTALSVLSKRISRTAFIFGKYGGVAAAVSVASFTNIAFLLLTLRIGAVVSVGDKMDLGVIAGMILIPLAAVVIATFRNYFRGRSWIGSFTTSFIAGTGLIFCLYALFDKNYTFVLAPDQSTALTEHADATTEEYHETTATTYDWDVARAGLLTIEAVLLLAGVSVAVSTRLDTGGNLLLSGGVFLGGLTSEYLHGLAQNPGVGYYWTFLANLWYAIVPNLQTFWMSDAITREHAIPWTYVSSASMYAVSYILATLFLAAFLFQKREIT